MKKTLSLTKSSCFLQHVADRVKIEILEERADARRHSKHEPLLDLLHGIPGSGKSKVIHWLRRMFEEAMGWEHGVQFVCLAFQNAMAANIDGKTIHHWSGIPQRR